MLLTALVVSNASAKDYEYIVVGAGSAGSIVASELVRDGANVLLVEAGGDNTDPAVTNIRDGYFKVAFNLNAFFGFVDYTFTKWGYRTTPQGLAGAGAGAPAPREIDLPAGQILGGSGSINAAAYVQANKQDFDDIAAATGDNQWLFDRTQNVRNRLENRIGITTFGDEQVGGTEFLQAASSALGFNYRPDCNNGEQSGICPASWTAEPSPEGALRHSSYDQYVRRFLFDRNNGNLGELDVVTFHQVEKLLFQDTSDPTKVTGVQCFNSRVGESTTFTATEEVIVSAGTYNTPKILMLSGIGPHAHLDFNGIPTKVDLPGVGSNLRDHYTVSTFWNLDSLQPANPFIFQTPNFNMFGPETSGQTTYQFTVSGNFGSVSPLRQESSGTVRLLSNNFADAPVIDPNALSTAADVDVLVTGLKDFLLPFFGNLISQGLVTAGQLDPATATEAELRTYVLDNVSPGHHAVGTCKIGDTVNDAMAVVDNDFLVKGTSNLRVVDASIFPKVPSGNTNGPTMTAAMLAGKKLRRIRNDRRELLRGSD